MFKVRAKTMCCLGGLALVIAAMSSVRTDPATAVGKSESADATYAHGDPTQIMGPDACAECHENEHHVWMDSAHQADSQILTRNPEAKRIAKVLGVRRIKTDDRCASCHFTSQQLEGKRLRVISGVSCESCHSPAANWIDPHAQFGPGVSSSADENPEHRADRHQYCDSMGMNRPERLYEIASACYTCHGIFDSELVQTAGHPAGDAFEFASWSQGDIRHNFVRAGTGQNPASAADRVRVMYLVGAALRLEYACRAAAKSDQTEGVVLATASLQAIVDATGITDATELVEIGETVLDASSAADAIQRVQTIAIRIAENRVGAEAKELDAFIPKPRTRAGAGQ